MEHLGEAKPNQVSVEGDTEARLLTTLTIKENPLLGPRLAITRSSNLVDSASSHTLVSKIKPCMSKYKYSTLKLRMAHYISYSLFDSPLLLGYL